MDHRGHRKVTLKIFDFGYYNREKVVPEKPRIFFCALNFFPMKMHSEKDLCEMKNVSKDCLNKQQNNNI